MGPASERENLIGEPTGNSRRGVAFGGRARGLLVAALAGALGVSGIAQTLTAPPPADDQELHKVNGIFDTDLPKTERKGSVRFIVHPHLGDFTSRSYLRVPLGLRWGVNDHVELTGSIESYLQHGLKHDHPGDGLGDVQFGGKYEFPHWLKPDFDASVGFNAILPVGHPPLDLTDGYNHYAPYFVLSRKSARTPGLTYFYNVETDFMEKSSVAGSFRKDDPHSSSILLGTGFVLDRFPYHYTLETGFQTTSLIGRDNRQFVFVKPGFAWDLPRRLTFDSHGRWLLGISVRITEGPDGTRVDSGGKLRGEISISRWFHRDPASAPRNP